jgi:hypothetical protein
MTPHGSLFSEFEKGIMKEKCGSPHHQNPSSSECYSLRTLPPSLVGRARRNTWSDRRSTFSTASSLCFYTNGYSCGTTICGQLKMFGRCQVSTINFVAMAWTHNNVYTTQSRQVRPRSTQSLYSSDTGRYRYRGCDVPFVWSYTANTR